MNKVTSPQAKIDDKMLLYSDKFDKETVFILKQKAAEKTRQIQRRKKAAVTIQSIWRGIIFRRKFRKIKPKLVAEARKRMQKIKKLEYIRRHAGDIICEAVYDYILKRRAERKELLRKYVEHCAIMIQKNYKGYAVRREFQLELHNYRRLVSLLSDVVKGWKTRKCWENKSVGYQRKEILELQHIHDNMEEDGRSDFQAPKKKFYRKIKQKKLQFERTFYEIYETGSWMFAEGGNSRNSSMNKGHLKEIEIKNSNKSHVNEEKFQSERKNSQELRGHRKSRSISREEERRDESQEERSYERERPINAYEARENMPIGGEKKANEFFMENEEPPQDVEKEQTTAANQKREFLKKKPKYDPKKAIEESKKKADEEDEAGKKNKSEEFRDMIKAARSFGKPDANAQKKPAAKKDGIEDKENQKIKEQVEEQHEEEEKDGNSRKFTFLKRKSRNPEFQKLNWKKVSKRVNCWGKRGENENSRSVSPKRERLPSPKPSVQPSRGRPTSTSQEKYNSNPARPQTSEYASRGQNRSPVQKAGVNRSPPSRQQQKPKGAVAQKGGPQPVIQISELEKAFKSNFSTKFSTTVVPFFSKGSVRDPDAELTTFIPMIKTDSNFVKNFDISRYQNLMQNLDKQYKQLQMIS